LKRRRLAASGAAAQRDFVQSGGTLITFNNASLFAITQFGLPIANVLGDLKPESVSTVPDLCCRSSYANPNRSGGLGTPARSDRDV
jgi:hypothetical protein